MGVFDSGVGGLSIAKCIAKQLPHENLIYVADSLHAPYGEKSIQFINERVLYIAEQLIQKEIKALVVACNTATVNAIEQLRARVSIPVIGVEPAIKPATKFSLTKKVAVLATQATSTNLRFQNLIAQHHNGAEVLIQPCPGLVEFIEQGQQNSAACQQLLKRYIEPLLHKGVDALVLGCTHYPFLLTQINDITDNKITIIETSAPVTLQLSRQLIQTNLAANNQQQAQYSFYSSAATLQQQKLMSSLWEQPITLQSF
ncbi:glutamate racemase [Colwellia sp. D2M02]|nr:glutamate racemase [Colwellia sp. D2M02]